MLQSSMNSRVPFASNYNCTVHDTSLKEMKRKLTAAKKLAVLLINSQEERVSLECHPVCKRGYNCLVTKTHSMLQDGQCLGGNQYL